MSTLFHELKARIAETTAATSIQQFHALREEIENGCYTPDERGELDELLAEAFINAKAESGVRSAEIKPAQA